MDPKKKKLIALAIGWWSVSFAVNFAIGRVGRNVLLKIQNS